MTMKLRTLFAFLLVAVFAAAPALVFVQTAAAAPSSR
jgi:hypothetical protein